MKATSKNVKETGKIGAHLAKNLTTKRPGKIATVVALEGELGAGKTVFVKAFAKAKGIKTHITSPTFVIMKPYKMKMGTLYHIDAYRLKDHRDLIAIGIEEILADEKNIVLIEWSDRVRKILPKHLTTVHIDHVDRTTRRITIK